MKETGSEGSKKPEKKRPESSKIRDVWMNNAPERFKPERWKEGRERREDRIKALERSIKTTCDHLKNYADFCQYFAGENQTKEKLLGAIKEQRDMLDREIDTYALRSSTYYKKMPNEFLYGTKYRDESYKRIQEIDNYLKEIDRQLDSFLNGDTYKTLKSKELMDKKLMDKKLMDKKLMGIMSQVMKNKLSFHDTNLYDEIVDDVENQYNVGYEIDKSFKEDKDLLEVKNDIESYKQNIMEISNKYLKKYLREVHTLINHELEEIKKYNYYKDNESFRKEVERLSAGYDQALVNYVIQENKDFASREKEIQTLESYLDKLAKVEKTYLEEINRPLAE